MHWATSTHTYKAFNCLGVVGFAALNRLRVVGWAITSCKEQLSIQRHNIMWNTLSCALYCSLNLQPWSPKRTRQMHWVTSTVESTRTCKARNSFDSCPAYQLPCFKSYLLHLKRLELTEKIHCSSMIFSFFWHELSFFPVSLVFDI